MVPQNRISHYIIATSAKSLESMVRKCIIYGEPIRRCFLHENHIFIFKDRKEY